MIEIIGYKCEFCSMETFNKAEMKWHEEQCSYNPKNRACDSCKFYLPNITELSYGASRFCEKDVVVPQTTLNSYRQNRYCEEWELFTEEL